MAISAIYTCWDILPLFCFPSFKMNGTHSISLKSFKNVYLFTAFHFLFWFHQLYFLAHFFSWFKLFVLLSASANLSLIQQ